MSSLFEKDKKAEQRHLRFGGILFVDKEFRQLVRKINKLPFAFTTSCCTGHIIKRTQKFWEIFFDKIFFSDQNYEKWLRTKLREEGNDSNQRYWLDTSYLGLGIINKDLPFARDVVDLIFSHDFASYLINDYPKTTYYFKDRTLKGPWKNISWKVQSPPTKKDYFDISIEVIGYDAKEHIGENGLLYSVQPNNPSSLVTLEEVLKQKDHIRNFYQKLERLVDYYLSIN